MFKKLADVKTGFLVKWQEQQKPVVVEFITDGLNSGSALHKLVHGLASKLADMDFRYTHCLDVFCAWDGLPWFMNSGSWDFGYKGIAVHTGKHACDRVLETELRELVAAQVKKILLGRVEEKGQV